MKQALTQTEIFNRLQNDHTIVDKYGMKYKMVSERVCIYDSYGGDWVPCILNFVDLKYYDPESPKPEKKTVTVYRPVFKFNDEIGRTIGDRSFENKKDYNFAGDKELLGWTTEEVEYEVQNG